MERALITGATGFIGPYVVDTLVFRNVHVTCLVRPTSDRDRLRSDDVEYVLGDVTDFQSVTRALRGCRPDVVYHLAGVTRALRKTRFWEVNERGTWNVAKACADRTSPPELVVASSLAAAGPAVSGRPITENDMPSPVSHYGRSKLAGEHAARHWAKEVGMSIVRPPIVFGAGDRDLLALFQTIKRFGIHLVSGMKDQRFSLIHASDLAEAMYIIGQRGERLNPGGANGAQKADRLGSGTYFVADDQTPSSEELGRMMAEALGRSKVFILRLPGRSLPRLGGCFGDALGLVLGAPLILNSDKITEALAGSWTCSNHKIKRRIGFAVETPLASRLRETVLAYRREGLL